MFGEHFKCFFDSLISTEQPRQTLQSVWFAVVFGKLGGNFMHSTNPLNFIDLQSNRFACQINHTNISKRNHRKRQHRNHYYEIISKCYWYWNSKWTIRAFFGMWFYNAIQPTERKLKFKRDMRYYITVYSIGNRYLPDAIDWSDFNWCICNYTKVLQISKIIN